MNYKTLDGNTYPEYTAFPRYKAPCTIVWVCLQVGDKQLRWFDLSQLREVVSPFETGLLYTCAEPPITYTCQPPPLTLLQRDYLDALTEVFNTRNTERQKSRDLYITELYDAIADELEAA